MSTDALRRCPFCGHKAELRHIEEEGINYGAYYIECRNKTCAVTTNLRWSEKGNEGIQALRDIWNKRVGL